MGRLAVSLAALSLLLLAPVSPAQAPTTQKPLAPQTVVHTSPGWLMQAQPLACPVGLDVRHGAGFGQVVATDGFTRKPSAQLLDVTVTNPGSSEIASLDVIVQVRSGKSRMMPLGSEEGDLGERLPLHFDMSVKADKEAAATWSVASTHAVEYVEISKVNYRDSSSWSASEGAVCQFTLNPIMLISSR